jgi:hypothetical protein
MRTGSTWLTELLCAGLINNKTSGYDYIKDISYFSEPNINKKIIAKSHNLSYKDCIDNEVEPFLIMRNVYDSVISFFNYNYIVMPNEKRTRLPAHEIFFDKYKHIEDEKHLVNMFITENEDLKNYFKNYLKYLNDYKSNIKDNVITYEQMIFNTEITLEIIVDKLRISDVFDIKKAINTITLQRFLNKKTKGFCLNHKSGHYVDILYPETIDFINNIINN